MDWEKDLCEQLDNLQDATSEMTQDLIRNGILDTVEELVLAAYKRGRDAGILKARGEK